MPIWGIFLSIFAALLVFGLIYDHFAKKRNVQFTPSEGEKYTTQSERIYKEVHDKHVRDNVDNNLNNPFL